MAEQDTHDKASVVPSWVESQLFEELLKETVPQYKRISDFKAVSALGPGENYATLMLRVEITVELNDGKSKSLSFMLKLPHDSEQYREVMKNNNIFHVETNMYFTVVPEFEKLYRDAGVELKFGANYHKLQCDKDNILLEDLRTRGFKNANRLEGLDMEHTKCVLRKLAQWHAASAVRVATVGPYEKRYTEGFFTEEQKPLMKTMSEMFGKSMLRALRSYLNNESIDCMEKMQGKLTDELYRLAKPNPNEFSVLNHGDCWSNNIMFQYDAFGKIKETYFVDYQIPKYGSPAQDLYYFLLSSTKFELKLNQFDYFIKFYHDCLVENLQTLKYPKHVPTLTELHSQLYKYGLWGVTSATGIMAVVLLDPTEEAKFENFFNESTDGTDLKQLMFTSPRYRKQIPTVLAWLHNRGATELW